jgi:hypothetical protein
MNQKMLTTHKQAQQLNSFFSTYELREILLEESDNSDVDFELDDFVEVSDDAIGIDEVQIGKLYLCL